MSREHDLPSDSDDDDEDYVPEGADVEQVSEVESDGVEENLTDSEKEEKEGAAEDAKSRRQSRGKKGKKGGRRKNISNAKTTECEEDTVENDSTKPILTEEEEKKRADSLWADFMKDTATVSKPKPEKVTNGKEIPPIIKPKVEEKIKITKIFEFAGEEVKVEKEVSVDSAEARLTLPSVEKIVVEAEPTAESMRGLGSRRRGTKRTGLGGISSVLGQIGKKAKISTLEKSKLDWDNFKREENIDDEINTHNRGKDGYLERQDFLQRADLRQFEIEKQLRMSRRNTR